MKNFKELYVNKTFSSAVSRKDREVKAAKKIQSFYCDSLGVLCLPAGQAGEFPLRTLRENSKANG